MNLTIDKMRHHDTEFIMDSWLRSYRNSPAGRRVPNGLYYPRQRSTIDRCLWFGKTAVMRPHDWPEGIVGWLCAEQLEDTFVVHYAFVKRFWRDKGVFRLLLESMDPRGRRVFSHCRPPYTDYLRDMGFSHAPHLTHRIGDQHVGTS